MTKKSYLLILFILLNVQLINVAYAFTDLSSSHKYSEAINFIEAEGIISGYPDGTYRPNNPINRAEFMKIIVGAKYGTSQSMLNNYYSNCFNDVPDNQWYTPYICLGRAQGIVSGYPNGDFGPGQNINVVEAFKIILKAFSYSPQEGTDPWYRGYVDTASNKNLIPLDIYYFGQLMNRGQMAEFITRVLKEKDGTLSTYLGEKADIRVTYQTMADNTLVENQISVVSTQPITEPPQVIEPSITKDYCLNSECQSEISDYVIITRPKFIDAIEEFVTWKDIQGFDVGIITVEYINDNYSGSDISRKMKNLIKEFANNRGTKYFVLIGDAAQSSTVNPELDRNVLFNLNYDWNVPSAYFCSISAYNTAGGSYSSCILGTDLFYADFDEEGWQENTDGYIMRGIYSYNHYLRNGELIRYTHDSDDPHILDFETIIARIPIREASEFENIFYKLRNYQPAGFDLITSVELFNEEENIERFNAECVSDFFTTDYLKGKTYNCTDNPYANIKYLEEKDSRTSRYIFDITDITEQSLAKNQILNNRKNAIISFHGYLNYIEVFHESDVESFTSIFPVWMPHSCNMSKFTRGHTDVLAERIFKAQKGPAMVIFPTNQFDFLKNVLNGKTVGEAYYNINTVIPRYTTDHKILFGDPSLKIYGSSKL
jgi:hypothetical protein